MDRKIIGLVGASCYDVPILASNVLNKLGSSACIVDASKDKELLAMCNDSVSGDDFESFEFKGITVAAIKTVPQTAEYIFIYFGLDDNPKLAKTCSEIWIICGWKHYEIKKVLEFSYGEAPRFLVLRDSYLKDNQLAWLAEQFHEIHITTENVFYLDDSEADTRFRYNIEYDNNFSMKKVGQSLKNLVINLLLPDFDRKTLSNAIKSVR